MPQLLPTSLVTAILLGLLIPLAAFGMGAGCAQLKSAAGDAYAIVVDCSADTARREVPHLQDRVTAALVSKDYLGELDKLAADVGRDVVTCALGKLQSWTGPVFASVSDDQRHAAEWLTARRLKPVNVSP